MAAFRRWARGIGAHGPNLGRHFPLLGLPVMEGLETRLLMTQSSPPALALAWDDPGPLHSAYLPVETGQRTFLDVPAPASGGESADPGVWHLQIIGTAPDAPSPNDTDVPAARQPLPRIPHQPVVDAAPVDAGLIQIDWGDGTASPLAPDADGVQAVSVDGQVWVTASHEYADPGIYSARVTLTEADPTSSAPSSANRTSATLTQEEPSDSTTEGWSEPGWYEYDPVVTCQEGQPATYRPYMVYWDGYSYNDEWLDPYQIDWGDGSPPDTVHTPTHVYDEARTYYGAAGYNSQNDEIAYGLMNITEAPLTVTAQTLHGSIVGDPVSGSVPGAWQTNYIASFTDAGGLENASEYSATIDWSDGTTSNGTVYNDSSLSANGYMVFGSHAYSDPGEYFPTITVWENDENGPQTPYYATGMAYISDLEPRADLSTLDVQAGQGASFVAGSPNVWGGAPTAWVTWGDGTTSSVNVSTDGDETLFGVYKHYPRVHYATTESATLSVQRADGGTEQLPFTFTASAAPADNASIVCTGSQVVLDPNFPTFAGRLGTFTDDNPDANPGWFSLTIHWGDGTESGGDLVPEGPGTYGIYGSHTYDLSGTPAPDHFEGSVDIGDTSYGSNTTEQAYYEGDFDETLEAPEGPTPTSGNTEAQLAHDGDPIRVSDGALIVAFSDLESDGFGSPWGHTRTWTNLSSFSNGVNGNGMVVNQWPQLQQSGSLVRVVVSGTDALWFVMNDGQGTAEFSPRQKLVANGSYYDLRDGQGGVTRFWAPGVGSTLQQGQFQSYTSPDGQVTEVTARTNDGRISQVQRRTTAGDVIESYDYQYLTSGPNAGRLGSVILERTIGGVTHTVREVDYTYYGGSEAHGTLGDLKTAVTKDADGNVLGTWYYRYYTPGDSYGQGYAGGLKFVFDPASFARLGAAVTNPFTATDAQVAAYAQRYLEYTADQRPYQPVTTGGQSLTLTAERVSKQVYQGVGNSATADQGLGTFTYTYSTNPADPDDNANAWKFKTVATQPDGTQNLYYCNYAGEVMLKVIEDGAGHQWDSFYKYNDAGRIVLAAQPSAVTGYDETYADLLHSQSGNYQYLADTSGLITVYSYYASTTATDTTPGGVAQQLSSISLWRGELGASTALLESWDYYARTGGSGASLFLLADQTVYGNANGTGDRTTSYSYTWATGSTRMLSQTIARPDDWSESGVDVTTIFFAAYGQPQWVQDADGFLHYVQVDVATGAITKTITDVETTQSGFTDLPSGWTTPAGGGLHLVTLTEVDDLGRPVKISDPNAVANVTGQPGNVTYLVYDDPDHEVRVYPGWQAGSGATTGPIEVVRDDWAQGYTETLTMSATPALTEDGRPSGAEAISDLQSLTRSYVNAAGQVTAVDDYFNLAGLTYSPSTTLGTASTSGTDGNYYHTSYVYGPWGRTEQVTSPTGTITRYWYDSADGLQSIWVGTQSPASGAWSPSNAGNLVKTTEYQYDQGGIGDGNVTQVTEYPQDGTANRVTRYYYDWRDRLIATKQGVQTGTEDTATNRPLTYLTLNNLGEVTQARVYDGDGITLTDANGDGVPDAPAIGLQRSRWTYSYDSQGRLSRASNYTGGVSTDYAYDQRGNLTAVLPDFSADTLYAYDGAGRVTHVYQALGNEVGSALVFAQQDYTYDASGHVMLLTDRQRFDDLDLYWGEWGPLGDPSSTGSTPKARVSSTAYYYDAAGRLTDSVNVGTNPVNGVPAAFDRLASANLTPATRSDTDLVTSVHYNPAGLPDTVTDPAGIVTGTRYDALGRTTATVEAYTGSNFANETDSSLNALATSATNRITRYAYDGDDHLILLDALQATPDLENPGQYILSHQKTGYVYGVTTSGGSALNSNDLLAQVRYPRKTAGDGQAAGDPSTLPADQETYVYDALGEATAFTDRSGTAHGYEYDVVGRLLADKITAYAPGSAVDQTVQRLGYAYDTLGRLLTATSYVVADNPDPQTDVLNQVQRSYNGLGQITEEWQEHAGAVATNSTLNVQYHYGIIYNSTTLAWVQYPNGRKLHYYSIGPYDGDPNDAFGFNAELGRLNAIADDNGSGGIGQHLEDYSYLGLDTIVQRSRPEIGVELTYIKQSGESNGDAGDQYTGLDRFGRVTDQRWITTDSTPVTTDRFGYTYDRDSNRLSKTNALASAYSEGYTYDALNRLASATRNGSAYQDWTLDALGNWVSFTNGGTTQTRTANAQNQITGLSGYTTPQYDAAGNTTTDEHNHALTYDAWGRLVLVRTSQVGTLLASYTYDALGRRITETHRTGTPSDPGSGTVTTDLYYSQWNQVIEEDQGGVAMAQNVWSAVYIDCLILRDQKSPGNTTGAGDLGMEGSGLDQRLYVQQDANFNVTALVAPDGNGGGTVVERYVQDPYGSVTVLNQDFTVRGNGTPGASDYQWVHYHQGGRLDLWTGDYHFRARDYDPVTGTWKEADPWRYVNGPSMYLAFGASPLRWSDPTGLDFIPVAPAPPEPEVDRLGPGEEGEREPWEPPPYEFRPAHRDPYSGPDGYERFRRDLLIRQDRAREGLPPDGLIGAPGTDWTVPPRIDPGTLTDTIQKLRQAMSPEERKRLDDLMEEVQRRTKEYPHASAHGGGEEPPNQPLAPPDYDDEDYTDDPGVAVGDTNAVGPHPIRVVKTGDEAYNLSWVKRGFTEVRYIRDSYGVKYTVPYNPETGLYWRQESHASSNQGSNP